MTRATVLAVTLVVVVVVAWIRHRIELEQRNVALDALVRAASAKDARRMAAIAEALAKPRPNAPPRDARSCNVGRSRIVRLDRRNAIGGELHDVLEAVHQRREPKEPSAWTRELDVVEGRAFLYDYAAERIVCVGTDAEDPHGTLVAY